MKFKNNKEIQDYILFFDDWFLHIGIKLTNSEYVSGEFYSKNVMSGYFCGVIRCMTRIITNHCFRSTIYQFPARIADILPRYGCLFSAVFAIIVFMALTIAA